jgi:alpha-L-arabinofuranosidase
MRRFRVIILGLISIPALFVIWGPALPAAVETQTEKTGRLIIHADLGKNTISRHIYGHFSEHLGRCIYEGYWVGEDSSIPNTRGIRRDVVEALKRIQIPNLRWPGGCFADTYHWKDGIGPHADRPSIVNTHWGGVTENNHFGTHEFLDLCEQLGCEPVICGNVGSGTVREMQEWVEYITFAGESPMADLRRKNGRDQPWKLRFFGVGNETWGCGGQMRPEYYADVYRRYQTYLRNSPGTRLFKVACGAYGEEYPWTEVLMREAGRFMQGLSYHYYTVPGGWGKKNSATEFDEADWFETMRLAGRIEEYLTRHAVIMDRFDPEKRVALIVDEWGNWFEVEPDTNPGFLYQQNTLRDALSAGLTLNIFNNLSERVRMANLAQTVNVLQALILTDGDKMILTPTYHVFELYKVHQDAVRLPIDLSCREYTHGEESIPALSASASRDKSGTIHVSLCNLDPGHKTPLTCELRGLRASRVTARMLTADAISAHNSFLEPDRVHIRDFPDVRLESGRIMTSLPPRSVVVLTISALDGP